MLWGSDLMVKGAVGVAQQAGISQAVIALSIVAIGTSLPELFIRFLPHCAGMQASQSAILSAAIFPISS